jgi:hypothetical protein
VSDCFTTLLEVDLTLLAANRLQVTFLVVGMDSASYIDIAQGVTCSSLEKGNASDFKIVLEITGLKGLDEAQSVRSSCLIISPLASCSQGRGAEYQSCS